jgi:Protein of unknown function (DUF2877)
MHVLSAPPAVSQSSLGYRIPTRGRAAPLRVALAVESIGYLVPRTGFSGRIHSVFAQACNITHGRSLLTLCTSGAADGPTTLRLARGAAPDLRGLFDVGEAVRCCPRGVQTDRTELRWMHANVWRGAPLARLLPRRRIDAHLRNAHLSLAQHRRTHTSVIDGEGAGVASSLRDACRALDRGQALQHVARLVGWGEGLTPAGDDFLVGLIAGLDALMHGDERRRGFHGTLAAALSAHALHTTPIAAHYLRLAASGHYTEPLIRLRHAWLCDDDGNAADAALRRALAVGATSGGDTVRGLLAGLQAWLPSPSIVEAA